jgi:hypothetical protein
MTALPDLMRRLDRKLDIQRGLHLTYDDLALLVASGAYAKLQEAVVDEEHARISPPKLPRGRIGDPFVYFIRSGELGPIKIGLSGSVKDRCAGLQICTAEQLTVMAIIQAPKEAERQLHRHFDPERIRGEWFRASPRLLSYIEQVAIQ